MKTIKRNSLKMFVSLPFIFVFLLGAYAQSGNNSQTGDKVEKPAMNLQAAIVTGNLEMVKQHIVAGTDINMKDPMSGSTPLITASTFGKTEIAKALIDANAELDIQNSEGSTALHAAAFFCRVEIVKLLLEAGADKTIENKHGATPRESVIVPFSEMKPIYEMIMKQLEPIGLKLDLKELEFTRPMVAILLQQ